MNHIHRIILNSGLALSAGVGMLLSGTALAQGVGVQRSGEIYHVRVCPAPHKGTAECHSHVVTDSSGHPLVNIDRHGNPFTTGSDGKPSGYDHSRPSYDVNTLGIPFEAKPNKGKPQPPPPGPPSGYGPADLSSAYHLDTQNPPATGFGTIAIVDAYGYANAESDLGVYRKQYGLGDCTTNNGCFTQVQVDSNGNVTSGLPDNTGWDQEQALDLDMASAICPSCKILLVEAKSNSYADLAAAEKYAASLNPVAISNSYGGSEYTSNDSAYTNPGIAITVSSGDSGFGVEYPASSNHVTAVGGTSLVKKTSDWSESAWSGAGSGCSAYFAQPSWQNDLHENEASVCKMRMVADVSAVADPSTGVAVYGPTGRRASSGWMVFGGTSVSAPIIAGVYALAGGIILNTPDFGEAPYRPSLKMYLNDVTVGTNSKHCRYSFLCTATEGYDGPTGLGTPNGTSAF